MRTRLSAQHTFTIKIALPTVLLLISLFFFFAPFTVGPSFSVAVICALYGLYSLWITLPLRAVELDDKVLVVSSRSKEEQISLTSIDNVRVTFAGFHRIKLTLNPPSHQFGRVIFFLPEGRFFFPGSAHSIAEQLRTKSAAERNAGT